MVLSIFKKLNYAIYNDTDFLKNRECLKVLKLPLYFSKVCFLEIQGTKFGKDE